MINFLEEAVEATETIVQQFDSWEALLTYLLQIAPALAASIVCIVINSIIKGIKAKAETALDNTQSEVKEAKRLVRDMQIECEKKDEQIREYQRMVKKCCDKIDDGE